MFLPTTEKGKLAALRGFFVTAGVLLIAYALFGYLSGEIGVVSGSRTGGPKHVRGDQVVLASFGYVSFAVAAFIVAGTPLDKPRPAGATSWRAIFVLAFIVAGIILVAFRTYSS